MKETKKVTPKKTTPKKTNTNSNTKPKVKDIVIEENFLDEEETDKRLVVFAVIAILVILATIVTLVIGCDRKKEEENKKPVDDIVVPEKKDDEEDEGVDTKEIVRKVTSAYTGKKTKAKAKNKKEDNVVEDKTYTVTYYLDDEIEEKYVKEGDAPEEYVPEGYKSCKYYKEEVITEESEEFDMTQAITGDINIYMSCELITYHIVYDKTTTNPTEYTVKDNDITLDNGDYEGWYKEETYENVVTTIDKSIIGDAKEENEEYYIYLFAKEKEVCEGTDCPVEPEEPTVPGTTFGMSLTTMVPETQDELSEEDMVEEGIIPEETIDTPVVQTEEELVKEDEKETLPVEVETITPIVQTEENTIETEDEDKKEDETQNAVPANPTPVVEKTEVTKVTEPKKEEDKSAEKPQKAESDEKKPEEEKTTEEDLVEETEE